MSSIHFIKTELAAAIARGVRQCVVVGSRSLPQEAFKGSPDQSFQVFMVDEEQSSCSPATFVPAQFASEALIPLQPVLHLVGDRPLQLLIEGAAQRGEGR